MSENIGCVSCLRVTLGSMVAVSSKRLMDDGKPSLPHSIWNVERTGTTHGFKLLGQTILTAGWPLSVACSRNSSSSASPVEMGRLVASRKLNYPLSLQTVKQAKFYWQFLDGGSVLGKFSFINMILKASESKGNHLIWYFNTLYLSSSVSWD